MFESFTKMMMGSLGLEEPWYIKGAEFKADEKALHIYIDIRRDAKIACPQCGAPTSRYGYGPNERIWRHGDCLFYPTYVHCQRPKVQCPHCGVAQVHAPFERKNSRFTLMFEGYAMLLMADMPVTRAAELLRCDEKSLRSILHYWVQDAVEHMDLSGVTSLAIDETSFRRGHSYVTVVLDAAGRRVIDVEEGRGKDSVEKFRKKLEEKGGSAWRITAVTSDMSKTYVPAIAENFPNAEHTIDKFHVKQVLTKAMDEVRRSEQSGSGNKQRLFRGRWLLMKPAKSLTEGQAIQVQTLSKLYPQTGRAYRIVNALDEFYACQTMEDAEDAFCSLYSWMRRCRLEPMKKAAQTLWAHKGKILNFFRDRLTNAISEGFNSLFQAAKRKARGYATVRGFIDMIFLIAGKLRLAVPDPLSLFH